MSEWKCYAKGYKQDCDWPLRYIPTALKRQPAPTDKRRDTGLTLAWRSHPKAIAHWETSSPHIPSRTSYATPSVPAQKIPKSPYSCKPAHRQAQREGAIEPIQRGDYLESGTWLPAMPSPPQ